MNLKEIINQDFRSCHRKAVQKAKMNILQTGFFLQFTEENAYLFLYEKGKQPQKAHFTELIGQKMIALGITAVDLLRAFGWLKSICQINHKTQNDSSISFLIFDSKNENSAVINVLVDSEYVESFLFWDLIKEYSKNYHPINT